MSKNVILDNKSINNIEPINAATLNNKNESELSVGNAAKLGDIDAKNYQSRIITNLFNPSGLTTTDNGVTCTYNNDGTYTINGTATSNTWCLQFGPITLPPGVYKGIGHPNDNNLSYWVQFLTIGEDRLIGGSSNETGSGTVITLTEKTRFKVRVVVGSGAAVNNIVIKPMITNDLNATYNDFVAYEDSLSYNRNINNYSLQEHRIGTWIDGKPLYRKVIKDIPFSANTRLDYQHGIANIDYVWVDLGACFIWNPAWKTRQTWAAGTTSDFYVDENHFVMVSSHPSGYMTFTLMYTKTTD